MSSRNSSSSMSRYRDSGNPDCKIYVGDLASSTSKQDLEDAFAYYGPIRNVWVARNPPGFAFIEFDDARDAEDAVRGADGRRSVNGRRVRVEMCNPSRKGFRGPPPRRAGRPFHPEDRCYECGKRGHYARDCRDRGGRGGGGGGGGRARSFSRSRSRSRDRRRSRSPQSRSRSRSRGKRSKSRSRGRSVSRSRSPSRTRTRDTKDRNGDA